MQHRLVFKAQSGSCSLWCAMQVTGRGLLDGGHGRDRKPFARGSAKAENVPRADVAVTAKVFTVPQIQGLRSTPVLMEYIMPSFIVVQTEIQ